MIKDKVIPFSKRLKPAPCGGGFSDPDYWTWCGSVIQAPDGMYHMFAARWPKSLPFFEGYKVASEVVRAKSNNPCGPFQFEEVVLPDRGEEYWDGRMTHNPFIIQHNGEYLLFYIGSTYEGKRPDGKALMGEGWHPQSRQSFRGIRIGIARAPSLYGPWERMDAPALNNRPDCWDNRNITNPAPLITPEGKIRLYYRAGGAKIGLAETPDANTPFERIGDEPIVKFTNGLPIEDPYVWFNGSQYEMICKDLTGKISGEIHGGIHGISDDGIHWETADEPKAYSRTLLWSDRWEIEMGCIERPFLLLENNKPTHFYAAMADGPGGFRRAANTWNGVIPLWEAP